MTSGYMNMLKSILLLVFLQKQALSFSSNFKLVIDPHQEECIHELFQENLLVTIEMRSNINVDYSIYVTSDDDIRTETKKKNLDHTFTTEEGGFYSICITNTYPDLEDEEDDKRRFRNRRNRKNRRLTDSDEETVETTREKNEDDEDKEEYEYQEGIENINDKKDGLSRAHVSISIKYGVSAKDYSSLPTMKKLKPLEYLLQVIVFKTEELYRLQNYNEKDSVVLLNSVDEILSKIDHFTIFVIITIVIVSLFEYLHLKNYFLRRKVV